MHVCVVVTATRESLIREGCGFCCLWAQGETRTCRCDTQQQTGIVCCSCPHHVGRLSVSQWDCRAQFHDRLLSTTLFLECL